MKTKEERETYWKKVREEWLRKEAEWQASHEQFYTVEISGYACDHPYTKQDEELSQWIVRLSPRQKDEFIALLRERGTYLENHVLMDWILEHDGKLWYRWAFRVTRDWRKK